MVQCSQRGAVQWINNGDVIRVGRQPADGFAVPWDKLISREHVELVTIFFARSDILAHADNTDNVLSIVAA